MGRCVICNRTVDEIDGSPYLKFDNGKIFCFDCFLEMLKPGYFGKQDYLILIRGEINRLIIEREPQKKKAKIDHRLRKKVYERDKYRCVYCGDFHDLSLDHVIPESKGGKTNAENLVTCCMACNLKKSNKTLDEAKMSFKNK